MTAAPQAANQNATSRHATFSSSAAVGAGAFAVDLGSLTSHLQQMDTASLEMIKGYASGFIDGRSASMPQFSQVGLLQ